MPKTSNGIYIRWAVIMVLVAIIGLLATLGILPWAKGSDLEAHKREDAAQFEKLDKLTGQMDELHHLFFPKRKEIP